MADNFEPVDGGVKVRDKDGRFQRVPTPEGFTDLSFRNGVAAYYAAYRTLGYQPSVSEVHQFWPKMPVKTYSKLFLTDEFKDALRYRGIEWEPDSGLSMEQLTLLTALANPFDKRPLERKLKELGVPMPRYQAWLHHPLFAEALDKQSRGSYQSALPALRNRLIGNAEAGDQRAIELIFAMTGEWNPAQMQLEDARTVVEAIVNAVVKHVTDPEVRKAIMADVQMTAGTLGAIQQKALRG